MRLLPLKSTPYCDRRQPLRIPARAVSAIAIFRQLRVLSNFRGADDSPDFLQSSCCKSPRRARLQNAGRTDSIRCRGSVDRRSMFLSGRSLQQSDGNLTSVEIYVSVNPALKHQRCRSLCFWKFASLHPICKIEVHLWPESFLSIRKYASYYGLPLLRRVVGQYVELETLPYPNFRLHHLNSLICFVINGPV